MRYLLFLLSTLSFSPCLAQRIDPWQQYYPENKTLSKNRIRSCTDNSKFIQPGGSSTEFYDTLGRAIGKISKDDEKFTPLVYTRSGDTAFCIGTEPESFERFVYNKRGQIASYFGCNSYLFVYEEFYYDDKSQLKTKLSYISKPRPVAIARNMKPTEMELADVIHYSYNLLRNGNRLTIGKHALGPADSRATDSTIFDRQNRMVRFNSFQKRGISGELSLYHLNNITEYSYTDSSVTKTEYSTYCRMQPAGNECLGLEQMEKNISLVVYNVNGTKKVEYGFYRSGERYLVSRYEYGYY